MQRILEALMTQYLELGKLELKDSSLRISLARKQKATDAGQLRYL